MKTKVYSYNPKGKGYTLYVTKSRNGSAKHPRTARRPSKPGPLEDYTCGLIARGIVYGLRSWWRKK